MTTEVPWVLRELLIIFNCLYNKNTHYVFDSDKSYVHIKLGWTGLVTEITFCRSYGDELIIKYGAINLNWGV